MNSGRQKHSTRKQDQIFSAKLVLDIQFKLNKVSKLWLFMSDINTEAEGLCSRLHEG